MNTLSKLRMLPWSQEAEQPLIGAMLLNSPVAFGGAQPLEPRHFFDSRHSHAYAAIQRMTAKRVPVDVVTVWEELKSSGDADAAGGIEYLNILAQSTSGVRGVSRHAEIVREYAMRRAMLEAADSALELASEPGGDVNEKLDQITTLFGALQRQQLTKVPRSLADVALERTAHWEALQSGAIQSGWAVSIPTLNDFLNGGWQPGRFYILAARPSIGKSSIAQFLLMGQAALGRKTLLLSLEMSCEELADRATANAGRINYKAIQRGQMSESDWSRATAAIESDEMRNVYVDDQGALTLMDIRAKAKQIPGLSLLVVDYLQMCAGSIGKGANRNAEIEQISRGLKALAKELNITVIALSQLNREVEKRPGKRPILSDLRDSGAVEQDADVIMFLWPVRDLGNSAKLIGLGLDKNRQGIRAEVALHFDGAMQRWSESSESIRQSSSFKGPHRRSNFEDDY